MDFLELVEMLMNQGLSEDDATREAYAELFPEAYCVDDYDDFLYVDDAIEEIAI